MIMFYRMFSIYLVLLLFALKQPTFCSALQLTVTAGEDVTIPCTFVAAYPVWTGPEIYNGNSIQYNNPGNSYFANPRIPPQKKARLGWASDNKSLIIKNVAVTDEGLYQCGDQNNLFVRVPPRAPLILNTETSSDNTLIIRASQSTETKLVCVSTGGYPEPQVEWYRGNTGTQPLISTSTVNSGSYAYNVTKTYTFSPQGQDDGVTYVCQSSFLTDPKHTNATSVGLVLNLKPNQPTVVQTSVVSAGNTVEVRCTTTGSRPAAAITWSYRNTNPTGEVTETLDDTTKTYTVVSLLRIKVTAEDNGQSVQCKVTHTLLVQPPQLTASVRLNVRSSITKFFVEGHSGHSNVTVDEYYGIRLSCEVDINLTSTVKILFNGEILTASSNTKQISFTHSSVTCLDAGEYTCEGNNQYGQSSKESVKLFVNCSPRPLHQIRQNITSALHAPVTLSFTVLAYPLPVFAWFKENGKIWTPVRSNADLHISLSALHSTLTILNVSKSDYGRYRLDVENNKGSYVQYLYLEEDVAEGSPEACTKCSNMESDNTAVVTGISLGLVVAALAVYSTSITILYIRKTTIKDPQIVAREATQKTYVNVAYKPNQNKDDETEVEGDDSRQYTDLAGYPRDARTTYEVLHDL